MEHEIHPSARKHGVADDDIHHAIDHLLVEADIDEGDKVLRIGPDYSGNLLEVVSIVRRDEPELVIHAMRARPAYVRLLPAPGPHDD